MDDLTTGVSGAAVLAVVWRVIDFGIGYLNRRRNGHTRVFDRRLSGGANGKCSEHPVICLKMEEMHDSVKDIRDTVHKTELSVAEMRGKLNI